jgi:hypothetical protein
MKAITTDTRISSMNQQHMSITTRTTATTISETMDILDSVLELISADTDAIFSADANEILFEEEDNSDCDEFVTLLRRSTTHIKRSHQE